MIEQKYKIKLFGDPIYSIVYHDNGDNDNDGDSDSDRRTYHIDTLSIRPDIVEYMQNNPVDDAIILFEIEYLNLYDTIKVPRRIIINGVKFSKVT